MGDIPGNFPNSGRFAFSVHYEESVDTDLNFRSVLAQPGGFITGDFLTLFDFIQEGKEVCS
ncbi:unnamed protein product [marine sediment metagenome]|uniref:Uncharacterized protein n=1 Tax=marine sediment metagenome TaxID=412755 RepID=X1KHC4_9ZZZZ